MLKDQPNIALICTSCNVNCMPKLRERLECRGLVLVEVIWFKIEFEGVEIDDYLIEV